MKEMQIASHIEKGYYHNVEFLSFVKFLEKKKGNLRRRERKKGIKIITDKN